MGTNRPMIAALTGAGISTDSGIPDFRGPNGVWTRNPGAEKLFTFDGYMADPEVRRASWLARRDNAAWTAEPNAAHLALAELETSGFAIRVITQNIDGLHQSSELTERKVIELHGSMFSVRCMGCDDRTTMRSALNRVAAGEDDPACLHCGGILKSGTTMFGEMLNEDTLNDAILAASSCDIFWAIGTSLTVEPAASLCAIAAKSGARVTIVNADRTPYDAVAAEVIREPIGTAVPRLVNELLASSGSMAITIDVGNDARYVRQRELPHDSGGRCENP